MKPENLLCLEIKLTVSSSQEKKKSWKIVKYGVNWVTFSHKLENSHYKAEGLKKQLKAFEKELNLDMKVCSN